MMKMDFDKEAREALEELCFSASEAGLQMAREFVAATLRRAFLAGQESMRGRIADGLRSEAVGETSLAHAIRSTPLLEEPNKEVAG